jgi:hypothetical protein
MVEVIFRDGKSQAQRIQDRLRCSSPNQGAQPLPSQGQTTTQPTRTTTTIYYGSSQGRQGPVNPGETRPAGRDILSEFGKERSKG